MSRALPCSCAVPGRRGESGLSSLFPEQEDAAGFRSGFCAGDALQKEQQFLHTAVMAAVGMDGCLRLTPSSEQGWNWLWAGHCVMCSCLQSDAKLSPSPGIGTSARPSPFSGDQPWAEGSSSTGDLHMAQGLVFYNLAFP